MTDAETKEFAAWAVSTASKEALDRLGHEAVLLVYRNALEKLALAIHEESSDREQWLALVKAMQAIWPEETASLKESVLKVSAPS
jgi:Lon protease-like protein